MELSFLGTLVLGNESSNVGTFAPMLYVPMINSGKTVLQCSV